MAAIIGTWRTTRQIAKAVNLPEEAVRSILEALRRVGSVEHDGGLIIIWKATIENQLHHHGIRIAIDRESGSALLLFKATDSDIVKDVAHLHRPFEIELTARQRAELTESLDYYDRVLSRAKDKQSRTQTGV